MTRLSPDARSRLPGTRLLAFVRLWFDERTLSGVFEPLVADWQSEWQKAPRAARWRVRARGLAAFLVTAAFLTRRIALAPLPARLAGRVTRHVLLFCGLSVLIQGAVTYMKWPSAALPSTAWLFLLPALFTTLLPFAIVAGVDAIRCHEAWPDHVERRAAFKLVAVMTVWMVIGGGWVVPSANRQWQTAVDLANAGQPVAPWTRVGGLTTYQLLTGSDQDWRSTTLLFPGERRREFEQRASFALLPFLFLWIRWRLLDQGPTGWFVPPPISVIGAIAGSGVILLRALYRPFDAVTSPGLSAALWITVLLSLALANRSTDRSQAHKIIGS